MESKIQEKNWSKEMEQDIFEKWKHNEDYKFHAGKEVFAIDTPPP